MLAWLATAGSVVTGAAWVWTAWRFAEWKSRAGYPSVGMQLARGSLLLMYIGPDPARPGLATRGGMYTGPDRYAPVDPDWSWWRPRWRNGLGVSQPWCAVNIPLWIPLALCLTVSGAAWIPPRRRERGVCHKCGYDLAGNTTGVCPECGETARAVLHGSASP